MRLILCALFLFFIVAAGQVNGFFLNEQQKPVQESGSGQSESVEQGPHTRLHFNRHDSKLDNKTLKNLCYCSYGPDVCELEDTCIKHEHAACFHGVRQFYNSDEESGVGEMHTEHFYGCAPLERGTNSSDFTCNAWRSTHSSPSTIICCYEGNFCNVNITPRRFSVTEQGVDFANSHELNSKLHAALIFLGVGCLLGILFILIGYGLWRYFYTKEKIPMWMKNQKKRLSLESTESSLLAKGEGNDHSQMSFEYTSGSGSGALTLNQRTIALDLTILETVARGRYGEVRKAMYRGSIVAVKTFYTTEEESWKNERDIYQTQMLNHENVLQYVAADISSSVDSITTMMLITDYHALGSLYDYLRAGKLLDLDEALQIALSVISGIEHLHNAVRGTGTRKKPEIAHRDIKSKNVIVKRAGVCCIADFGLAVRCENRVIIPEKINIQVGTKRYMAPELLARTLNTTNFDEFKMADIYSYALVLWEVLQRVEINEPTNNRQEDREHQRIMSCSSSSGIATGSDRTFNSVISASHETIISANANGSKDSRENEGEHQSSNLNNNLPRSLTQSAALPLQSSHHHPPTLAFLHHQNRVVGCQQQEMPNNNSQRPYMLPYQNLVESDPSFDQMRRIVCDQKLRPTIEEEWRASALMKMLCELMCECWSENAKSRHTSLKVKKELNQLISILHRHQTTT